MANAGDQEVPKYLRKTLLKAPNFRTEQDNCNLLTPKDDDTEKRNRRRDNLLVADRLRLSPGCHTLRSVARNPDRYHSELGTSNALSNSQIAEHYALCLKLTAENKLNTKKAFGLHLKDLMDELVIHKGEMLTNFQVEPTKPKSMLRPSTKKTIPMVTMEKAEPLELVGVTDSNNDDEEETNIGEICVKTIRRQSKRKAALKATQSIQSMLRPSTTKSIKTTEERELDKIQQLKHPWQADKNKKISNKSFKSLMRNQAMSTSSHLKPKPLTESVEFSFKTDERLKAKIIITIPPAGSWCGSSMNLRSSKRTECLPNNPSEVEEMKVNAIKGAQFKATESKSVYSEPVLPPKITRPLTEVHSFDLKTEVRAGQSLKKMEIEEEREMLRKKEEEEELKRLRKTLVHKAQPIHEYDPIIIQPSTKPLTMPVSPLLTAGFPRVKDKENNN